MSDELASRTILDTFAEYGFAATRTSMRFSRAPTFEEAEMVAKVASGAMDMSKWWLGDLILASEAMWGHKYAQLSAITNRSPEGLMVIASVAKRVEPDLRRETLSWSHHEAVASLLRERQVYWLDFAEENRLSVHELRPLVRAEKNEAEAEPYDRRRALARESGRPDVEARSRSRGASESVVEARDRIRLSIAEARKLLDEIDDGEPALAQAEAAGRRDEAAQLAVLQARRALDLQNLCAEIRLRAERRVGQLLEEAMS